MCSPPAKKIRPRKLVYTIPKINFCLLSGNRRASTIRFVTRDFVLTEAFQVFLSLVTVLVALFVSPGSCPPASDLTQKSLFTGMGLHITFYHFISKVNNFGT